mgnify:CR=1 FL=1
MSRALQINSSPQGWMARNTKPVPLAEKGWVITMKKISIILLSAVLVFSMAACNGGKEKADNQTEKQTESVKPTEEVAMATEAVTEVTTEAGSDETEKDIAEVKNAYEIYERLDELDPYSVDDLLTAHGIMTRGLVEESGMFRTRPVGVVDQEGHVLHFGTLPQYVPDLVMVLLDWAKHSDLHMLIRSCVFHYELELIHPFADGNGRVGRLWHTLLLSKWNPVFAWLPVESIIHDHQQEYYDAINARNDAGESTAFIEFMLSVIKASLIDATHTRDAMSDGKMDKKALRWQKIEQFLQTHEYIMNADVRELCGVSAATANRLLAEFVSNGKLVKYRESGHWAYR